MLISEIFPSRWLNAADLNNHVTTVEIDKVTLEEVGSNREQKAVVKFKDRRKELILNKTNGRAIADLYGADTDGWKGKKVTLCPAVTVVGADEKPCIRIKAPQNFIRPEPSEAEDPGWTPEPGIDDEIPF